MLMAYNFVLVHDDFDEEGFFVFSYVSLVSQRVGTQYGPGALFMEEE